MIPITGAAGTLGRGLADEPAGPLVLVLVLARRMSATASVIPVEELRRSPTAALFEGGDAIDVTVFVTEHPPGRGAALHVHPYPELFVVQTGTATFTAGDEQLTVGSGHLVLVPADTPHGFRAGGDATLRITSVQPSPVLRQTDL